MEVGPIVRVARMRRGLTQAELAALVGVSEIAVRQIEAGRRDPSLKTLERLLGALGLAAAVTDVALTLWDDDANLIRAGRVFLACGEELTVPVLPAHLVLARDPALSVLAGQAAEAQQRARSA
jgi:transcriptional regulator with XRE-family HTH domain